MKPRIGLNCDIETTGRLRSRVAVTYHDLVIQYGGIPLLIPPGVDPAEVAPFFDGILLIGGDDYRCGLKKNEPEPERFLEVHPLREAADLRWAEYLLASDLPVLGICGGFQLLSIVGGGSLIGDIEVELGSTVMHRVVENHMTDVEDELPVHEIEWLGGLPGAEAPGTYHVNSSHHQSVKDLPQGWTLLARSCDDVIEAACSDDGRIVGVQWHPEHVKMKDEPLGMCIVKNFIRCCNERSARDS
ncbi:MAG: gamma-glutamyl-gamma-aminobutyrate hydrolase family protein [Planctomycetota bacterium]